MHFPDSQHRARRRFLRTAVHARGRGGFTLIELVVYIAIMAAITGSIYGIVTGAIKTSSEMQSIESENDQVNEFIRLCRQAFQNLPSTATITLTVTDPGPPIDELTISGAPECFSFGANPVSYQDTVISSHVDTDATNNATDGGTIYSASITRQDIIPQDSTQTAQMIQATLSDDLAPDAQGRTWLPLLRNVSSLTWRCYQDDTTQWVDEWSNTNLPQLVEMNLQMHGRSQPLRVVFTIPGTQVAGANANIIPPSTAAAGGGGGGGGAGGPGGKGKGKGKGKGEGKGKGGEGKGKSGTNRTEGKGKEGSNKSESNKGETNRSSSKSSGSTSSKGGGGGSSGGKR